MASPTVSDKVLTHRVQAVQRLKLEMLVVRSCSLLLTVLALSLLAGCTHFQTTETSKWFDMSIFDTSNSRVSHVEARWDNRVRTAPDSVNGGRTLAGMAGRVYLFNDETSKAVDASGRLVVQMNDVTNVKPGQTAPCIGEYTFDPATLKRLKRSDGIGDGYTLFLPWESYSPNVRRVEMRVCYVPDEKGTPHFGEPSVFDLKSENEPLPTLQERVVPASNLVPKR